MILTTWVHTSCEAPNCNRQFGVRLEEDTTIESLVELLTSLDWSVVDDVVLCPDHRGEDPPMTGFNIPGCECTGVVIGNAFVFQPCDSACSTYIEAMQEVARQGKPIVRMILDDVEEEPDG